MSEISKPLPDNRDGPTAAAAEIVLLLVGFPSLSTLEAVRSIIIREITARGMPQQRMP